METGDDYAALSGCIDHIHRHLDEPLRLPALADMAGMSVYQLDQRIRALFRLSAGQYLVKVRIDAACAKLRDTAKPSRRSRWIAATRTNRRSRASSGRPSACRRWPTGGSSAADGPKRIKSMKHPAGSPRFGGLRSNGARRTPAHTMISISIIPQRSLAAGAWVLFSAAASAESAKPILPEEVEVILEDRCQSCHEDGTEKGDLRLDNLQELSLDGWLETLNRMQEQVYFKQMPPPDKKSQPTAEERKELLTWLSGELHRHKASKLEDKLRYPDYGNDVDHEQLFSGKIQAAAFTPARRWLVSPQIFDAAGAGCVRPRRQGTRTSRSTA